MALASSTLRMPSRRERGVFALEDGVGEVLQDLDVLSAAVSDGMSMCQDSGMAKAASASMQNLLIGCDCAGSGSLVPSVTVRRPCSAEISSLFTPGASPVEVTKVAVVPLSYCMHGGDIVFDFDFMETAELAEATDLLRHAEQPLEEVQIVWALVHEHAAALALPGAAPAAGGVVVIGAEPVGDLPMHAADRAELAAVDEVLHLLEAGVRAHVEHGGEDFALVRVRGDEALAVGLVNGNGLFDQHMQPGLERLDADGGVAEMRCADQNGVDVATADHQGSHP
jgi:hypothetical protein